MNAQHQVSSNLREITELAHGLLTQAIHKANHHDIPGGDAMIALAPVANQEAWEHRYETAERLGLDTSYVQHESDETAPPLQLLRYWSDRYRAALAAEYDMIPTLATEANFLRFHLDWIETNEPAWDQFARDITRAKTRLENMLMAGRRTERGVPCLNCNVDLIRRSHDRHDPRECNGHDGICYYPHTRCPHDRGGLRDEWACPSCERTYDEESYWRAVAHAAFVAADWLPLEDAMQRTGAKRGSIQGWATRGVVRKRKDENSGRTVYSIPDIETRLDRLEGVA